MQKSISIQPKKKIRWAVYMFVIPAFLFHFTFIMAPSLSSVYFSFFNWNGIGKPVYIGLDNYREMMADIEFTTALTNNLKWIAIFITIPVFLGLLSAYWVSKLKKTQMAIRTIYFMPYIIASSTAGRIWCSYFNPYFGFNNAFKAMGLTALGSTLWLGNKNIVLYSVAFVDVWHFWGFIMVMFLGALQQVDPTLYESAMVEGANKRQLFTKITIPCIMPTFVFIIISIIMWSFLTFDYIWVMTGGGPGSASEVLSTLIYKNAYSRYRTGYASAISVIQSILAILTYSIMQIVKKRGVEV